MSNRAVAGVFREDSDSKGSRTVEKRKHLVLVTPDPEKGADFAFDNPVFREGTPIARAIDKEEPKVGWPCWTPMSMLNKPHKPKALDDTYLRQPMVVNVVPLRSHDFTGLGFNICGNMRDGIFIKDVLHRGPASESGRIVPGDRIESIQISFRHMVFEDAIAILGYASPYEVKLEVESTGPSSRPTTLLRNKRTSISPAERICHPFYRSQSIADLSKIRKSDSYRMSPDHSVTMSDMSNGDISRPAIIETSPIDKMQKFGVRVLPPTPESLPRPADPEKHQNVRNSMIESTHHVQGSVVPTNPITNVSTVDGQMEEVDLSENTQDFGNSQTYDEPDCSNRKETSSPAAKESNMKAILVKGIQNLKEKLQPIVHKLDKDTEEKPSPDNPTEPTPIKKEMNESKVVDYKKEIPGGESDNINAMEKRLDSIFTDKIDIQSLEVSNIPEEVHKAGMAARSNRKSVVEVERKRKDSSGGESSNEGDGALPRKGKRKAPQPPQNNMKQDSLEDEQMPDTMGDKTQNLDSMDTDSEAGDRISTTIELNDSHITVHHAADSESNRKAASLGDLSRIDDDQPMVMLERAVSLDLADGTPGGSKKRKAPLPPQGEEFSDEGGSPFSRPKGARLDNGIKARLKKSSDWGTLEDAVKCSTEVLLSDDDDTDAGISGCSTPEKSSDLIISSTPYRPNSPQITEDNIKVNSVHVSSCSWDLSVPDSSNTDQFVTAVNGSSLEDNSEGENDTPPDLPTSPVPTYITEIQVITSPEKTATDKMQFADSLLNPSSNPKINVYNNYINSEHSSIDDNSLFSQSGSTGGEISSEKTIATTNFILTDLAKEDEGEDNVEVKIQPLSFISDKTPTTVDTTCQVSISQPNSIDPLINQELLTGFRQNSAQQIPHIFSSENMSDEQILALKSSSPEPLVLDNGTSKLTLTKPDRLKNNVSVTSIKTTGSRIPVRAPEPMQRKVKKSEPGSFVSFSSLNMSGNGDKQPYTDQNGTDHNTITHIFLDNSK